MSIIISDTTTITHLLQVGRLQLLPTIFGQVFIPPAVQLELNSLPWQSKALQDQDWLIVREPGPIPADELTFDLDPGETEAILIALNVQADLLIIDEAAGRIVAKEMGLSIIGILGILILAKERNLIENLGPIVEAMMNNEFRIHPRLLARVVRRVGE